MHALFEAMTAPTPSPKYHSFIRGESPSFNLRAGHFAGMEERFVVCKWPADMRISALAATCAASLACMKPIYTFFDFSTY